MTCGEIQMSPFSGKFVSYKKSAPWEWVGVRKLVTIFTQTNEYLRTLEGRRRDPDRSIGSQTARIVADGTLLWRLEVRQVTQVSMVYIPGCKSICRDARVTESTR